jgi:hypothetical protein
VERGAIAISSVLDALTCGRGDRELRFEAAVLIAGLARDIFMLRTAYTKPPER